MGFQFLFIAAATVWPGKISGIVLGVFLLRIIFVALNMLSISGNTQYIIKGLIILIACSIDMRKYLVKK